MLDIRAKVPDKCAIVCPNADISIITAIYLWKTIFLLIGKMRGRNGITLRKLMKLLFIIAIVSAKL